MRIKIIGDNNCARATRHLLRKAGFAVTEFLPADVVTQAPHSGYAITIDLAPAPHTASGKTPEVNPDPTHKPGHSTHGQAATEIEGAFALAKATSGASSPTSASSPASVDGNDFFSVGARFTENSSLEGSRVNVQREQYAEPLQHARGDHHSSAHQLSCIHFDSVDSELEAAILRHVAQLAATPVIVDRPGGVVHSERELRIVVPNSGDAKADDAACVAVEFGVLRGLLDLSSPAAPPASRGKLFESSEKSGASSMASGAALGSTLGSGLGSAPGSASGKPPRAGGKKWWRKVFSRTAMKVKSTQTEFAEKLNGASFRDTLRAEESLLCLTFTPRGIPHFVRNDDKDTFSANREVCATKPGRINMAGVLGRAWVAVLSFRGAIWGHGKYKWHGWSLGFRSAGVPLALTHDGPAIFTSRHNAQNCRPFLRLKRDAGATNASHAWRLVFATVVLLAIAGGSQAAPRRVVASVKPLRVEYALSARASVADRARLLPLAAVPPQGQFSTGQAPVKITDGTNTLVVDPCKGQTKLYVSINQTANTQLVAGTASKKIYICSIHVVVAVAASVALVEGTGSVCATGTAGVSGFGGATAATGWNFAVNGGIVVGNGDAAVGAEGTNADNLCLFNSGSGQVSGGISYVVQ